MNPEPDFHAPSLAPDGALRPSEPSLADTQTLPRVSVHEPPALRLPSVPSGLSGMLLPTERITFATRPHAIVLLRSLVSLAVVVVALAIALNFRVHPIVHGHHRDLPLLDSRMRIVAWTIGGAFLLRGLFGFLRAAEYYFGFRIVTTNRRVFVVQGLLGRRIAPLGNTAMAGSTLLQGPLGRMFGFGSIASANGPIRDVREPERLYREFQAVANGVDGDQWTPAIRQTQIP